MCILSPVISLPTIYYEQKNEKMHQRFVHKNGHHSKFVTEKLERTLNYFFKALKSNRSNIMEKCIATKTDVYK